MNYTELTKHVFPTILSANLNTFGQIVNLQMIVRFLRHFHIVSCSLSDGSKFERASIDYS